jgi:hypothetical protein
MPSVGQSGIICNGQRRGASDGRPCTWLYGKHVHLRNLTGCSTPPGRTSSLRAAVPVRRSLSQWEVAPCPVNLMTSKHALGKFWSKNIPSFCPTCWRCAPTRNVLQRSDGRDFLRRAPKRSMRATNTCSIKRPICWAQTNSKRYSGTHPMRKFISSTRPSSRISMREWGHLPCRQRAAPAVKSEGRSARANEGGGIGF